MKHFNQRKDSVDLIQRMENELGWKVYDTLADIDVTCKKYAVLANDDHMLKAADRGDFLPRAVKTALKTLTMPRTASSSWWKVRRSTSPVTATTPLG